MTIAVKMLLTCRKYIISLLFLIIKFHSVQSNCDQLFTFNEHSQQGSFEAPVRSNSRPFQVSRNQQGNLIVDTNVSRATKRPMHCIYKFEAKEGDRVALNFTRFKLRGDEPECSREYVDIYVKLSPGDSLDSIMTKEHSNGRFCTTVMPRRLVSLYNVLYLVFHSDLPPPSNNKSIFAGNFEFIASRSQDQIGPPTTNTICSHTIYSSHKKEGEFQSITYPGVYVKGLRCVYKFIGEPNQRVRLEFLDFDLYSGGSHCPLDSIRIYDGLEETDPIISTICGSHRSWIIFSTHENLMIIFTTLQREAEIQNRGFSAYFEFSDKFVDPSFIQGPNVRQIRGSECDQRIVSSKGTSGVIVSPKVGHHTNAVCRYIFEGLQSSTEYERVSLKFIEFDLKGVHNGTDTTPAPTTPPPTTTTTSTPSSLPSNIPINLFLLNQASSSVIESNSTNLTNITEQCPDNYVRLYTGEQKSDQRQDPNDYDYVFCGADIPQPIESDAASLLMEYNSGNINGYFKAEYVFLVDFRIPGIQASSGCDYLYRSDNLKSGVFNSPRHPSWYINDMNCSYTFLTKPDEALLLQFSTFKMFSSFDEKVLGYNKACKGEDLVEILELSLDGAEQKVIGQYEVGTYCGTTTPGPILSFRPVRINLRTNKEKVHYGFSANYNFYPTTGLKTNEFVTNCGGQTYASQRRRTGTITSPSTYRPETYEKRNHFCSWNITARPSHKIALDFEWFELEGSPTARGCITASVRLSTGRSKIPIELCGTLSTSEKNLHRYVSEGESLSLTFISTKQASGSRGFSANWTEVKK